MIKNVTKKGLAALVLAGTVATAHAEILDQMVSNGDFASAFQGSTGFSLTIEGNGVNQVSTLLVNQYVSGVGFTSWKGVIPNDTIIAQGVSSISVNVDTCTINNIPGCGLVDATVSKNPQDGGFIQNGVVKYTYGDIMQTIAGVRQVHRADAVGTVNGVTLTTARSFIGKDNEVRIIVEIP